MWNGVTVMKKGFYPDSCADTAPCRAKFLNFFYSARVTALFSQNSVKRLTSLDVHLLVRNLPGMMLMPLFVNRLKRDFFLLILNKSLIEFQPLAIDFEWNSIPRFNFYCTVRKNMGDGKRS